MKMGRVRTGGCLGAHFVLEKEVGEPDSYCTRPLLDPWQARAEIYQGGGNRRLDVQKLYVLPSGLGLLLPL